MRKLPVISILLSLFLFGVCSAQTPTANFKADVTSGCAPIVVNFQDLSSSNVTSWMWDFGNSSTSTLKNPSTAYLNPGTYTVRLTVTTASGSSNTITQQAFINVFDYPSVDFASNVTSGCSPYKIQFTDQSQAPSGTTNTTWTWDFGNGQQSTQQNPAQVVYRAADDYTVILKVTNNKGCSKTITKPNYIHITPGVVPNFSNTAPTVCNAPAHVSFTNSSTGPGQLSYTWYFGDGDSSSVVSPDHIYQKNGTYGAALAVTSSDGCTDTIRKSNVVSIGGIKSDFSVPNICERGQARFNATSSTIPIKTVWIFPDGRRDSIKNPIGYFPTPGTYSMTMISTYNSCVDSVTKQITVNPRPKINFTAPVTTKCQPTLSVNFQNTSTGTDDSKFVWDFGDSASSTTKSPQHNYTKFGNFSVTLIGSTALGCSDTLTKSDFIKIQKPQISFSNLPIKGCIPFATNLAASISTLDNVTSYKWDLGDGTTSTAVSPSHTYTKRGSYTVSLTITTSSGCTETFTLPGAVTVGTTPTADFTVDKTNVCASEFVRFTDKSTPANEVNEWLWLFGDNTTATQQNPFHQYVDTGWMHVTLTSYNSGCPSQPLTKTFLVYVKPPIARFDYRPNCSNKAQYTFTDKSIGAQSWVWDFGDGSPKVNGQNPPVHIFPGLGSYDVKLTVTNDTCSYTSTRTINIINKIPDFSAAPAEGCKPFQPTLTPSSPAMGAIGQWIWDFGNGTPPVSSSVGQPLYTKAGYYNVTLTAIDTFGCSEIRNKPRFIRVNGPVAVIGSTVKQGCAGFTASFNDQSVIDSIHKTVSWKWDFGDSTFSTLQNPTHKYNLEGFYDVSLVVKDAAGCTDSVSIPNYVKASKLKAEWDVARQTCPNSPVSFSNTSPGIFTSVWDFGDGGTATVNSPSHAYADTGFYTIKLVVSDTVGCADSLVRNRYVQVGRPVANFTANNFTSYCIPFEAKFTNQSTYFNASFWDLSNGTSRSTDPSIYYTASGTYNVKLVVTSPGGCQDSVSKQVTVYNPEDGKITYTPLGGCIPQKVSFEAFTQMNGRFIWDFGNGVVIDTTVNKIDNVYKDFGNFLPKVILKEPSGLCIVPLAGIDTIHMIGAKAKFKIDKQFFCDSGYIRISDSTTFNDPATFTWNYGDGTTSSNPKDSIHFYANPGFYSVLLTVRTQQGCIDSLRTAPIKIVQSPLISITGDSVICANDRSFATGVMQRPDTSVVRWVWRFPNGNTAFNQFPANQQYTQGGNFLITAIATNSSGCADTATQKILVHPAPVITAPSVITMQVGYPVTIPATYSSSVTNYLWFPDSTLSCNNCPQPVANPRFNTIYTVAVIDSNECKNTADVQVIVICKNANVYIPNTFSPNGDGSNDIFYVRGRGLDRVKTLRVFNRWGEVVFEKLNVPVNDPAYGWDGSFKGSNPKPDVYVYQVEVYCDNNQIIHFEGNVALIQ